MISMKRKSVKLFWHLLDLTGINVRGGQFSFYQLLRLCSLNLVLLCGYLSMFMYGYLNRNEMPKTANSVVYFATYFLLNAMMVKFINGRQDMKLLIESMDENVFNYSDEANIQVQYSWLLDERNTLKVYGLVLCYQSFGFILSGISPFIGYMLGSAETFLLFPGWIPWTIDDFGSFALSYLYQMLTGGCVFWVYFLAQIYIVFVLSELQRQYRRLGIALSTINQRTQNLLDDGTVLVSEFAWRPKYGDVFANQLCQCIRHHQLLVRLFRIFKSWFEVVFAVELTIGVITFAFILCNLLLTRRSETYLSLVGVGFLTISSLFTHCWAGEIFSALNEKIADTIFYEMNWLKLDKKNRRLVCMFHFYVRQQSLDLFAFSIFKASFFTFASFVRKTYSFFNLIRISLEIN